MHHTKDCIVTRPCFTPGSVDKAEHAALRDITRPITDHYRGEGWLTALAIVREHMEAAMTARTYDRGPYAKGRYEMARDILAEMEERGKP